MSFITNLFSGGIGKVADGIGNILDKVITTDKDRMALDNEMRKAEQQFLLENRKLDLQEREAEFADTKSARDTAATIQTSANATMLSKNTGPYLALGTVGLTFILFFAVLFLNKQLVASNTKDVVIYILGVLSAVVTQIFSFYFGSSQGSHDKQGMLNALNTRK